MISFPFPVLNRLSLQCNLDFRNEKRSPVINLESSTAKNQHRRNDPWCGLPRCEASTDKEFPSRGELCVVEAKVENWSRDVLRCYPFDRNNPGDPPRQLP